MAQNDRNRNQDNQGSGRRSHGQGDQFDRQTQGQGDSNRQGGNQGQNQGQNQDRGQGQNQDQNRGNRSGLDEMEDEDTNI